MNRTPTRRSSDLISLALHTSLLTRHPIPLLFTLVLMSTFLSGILGQPRRISPLHSTGTDTVITAGFALRNKCIVSKKGSRFLQLVFKSPGHFDQLQLESQRRLQHPVRRRRHVHHSQLSKRRLHHRQPSRCEVHIEKCAAPPAAPCNANADYTAPLPGL